MKLSCAVPMATILRMSLMVTAKCPLNALLVVSGTNLPSVFVSRHLLSRTYLTGSVYLFLILLSREENSDSLRLH